MLPESYSQAVKAKSAHYFTGVPCKYGHVAKRRTSNQCCCDCERMKSARWKAENPLACAESNRKTKARQYASLSEADRKLKRDKFRAWQEANRDKARAYCLKWNANNKSRITEISREWAANNRDRKNAHDAKRRAAELRAMPAWLTLDHHTEIEAVYRKAITLTTLTGIQHHVDHVVPLQGKRVCGLHVPWNLQAIPGADNVRKSNRHE